MEIAYAEIQRIREEIFDDHNMVAAQSLLAEATEYFAESRDEAARHHGFQIRESMKT
jgi:hypothetical protein